MMPSPTITLPLGESVRPGRSPQVNWLKLTKCGLSCGSCYAVAMVRIGYNSLN